MAFREFLVVFRAALVAAPVVILAPFIFSTPVFIVPPFFLADDGWKTSKDHMKTVWSAKTGRLKGFAILLILKRGFPTSVPLRLSLFSSPSTSFEYYGRLRIDPYGRE